MFVVKNNLKMLARFLKVNVKHHCQHCEIGALMGDINSFHLQCNISSCLCCHVECSARPNAVVLAHLCEEEPSVDLKYVDQL